MTADGPHAVSPVVETYRHESAAPTHIRAWIWPQVRGWLPEPPARICDIGCGNGWACAELEGLGYSATGLDPSANGVAISRGRGLRAGFRQWSVYEDAPDDMRGAFDAAVSLDVIEHLYLPRELAKKAMELLRPGGTLVLSTPYHGYLKNLALAVTGRLDKHFTALRDHGHIKFFSTSTLAALLAEAGFEEVAFSYRGRFPFLWKSMVVRATKPAERA